MFGGVSTGTLRGTNSPPRIGASPRTTADRGGGRPSGQRLVPKPLSKQANKRERETDRERGRDGQRQKERETQTDREDILISSKE